MVELHYKNELYIFIQKQNQMEIKRSEVFTNHKESTNRKREQYYFFT